jgi:hypothetical protein
VLAPVKGKLLRGGLRPPLTVTACSVRSKIRSGRGDVAGQSKKEMLAIATLDSNRLIQVSAAWSNRIASLAQSDNASEVGASYRLHCPGLPQRTGRATLSDACGGSVWVPHPYHGQGRACRYRSDGLIALRRRRRPARRARGAGDMRAPGRPQAALRGGAKRVAAPPKKHESTLTDRGVHPASRRVARAARLPFQLRARSDPRRSPRIGTRRTLAQ